MKPILTVGQTAASLCIDRVFGVRTTPGDPGRAIPRDLKYRPIGWLRATRLFRRYSLGPHDVLVDVGSGTGRAVLLAATLFRCRRIIGIERDVRLHAVACRNVDHARWVRSPVELVNDDALSWELPSDATVVFFYNSFRGEDFRRFVGKLVDWRDRSPHNLLLVYGNPREAEFLRRVRRFRLIDVLQPWRPNPDWARSCSIHVYEVV